ncbi:MAG: response regulator, partial [Pirellula sp.]
MTHVLIVDDEPNNIELMDEILVEYGFTTMSAQSIDEAVSIGTKQKFDVVLMDIAIPERRFELPLQFGGLEAVRLLRLQADAKTLPIIAVTAQGMPEARQKIFSQGITHIVEKSIELESRIVRALEAVLGKKLVSSAATMETTSVACSLPMPLVTSVEQVNTEEITIFATTTPLDTDPFQDSQSEPLCPTESPEPTASPPLRELVADHLASIRRTADRLIQEAVDTDRDATIITQLVDKLYLTLQRLTAVEDGPKPGESYGHWIVNLLLSVHRDVKKLKRLEDNDHFGSWSVEFALMEAHLEQAFRAARSPAGQEYVPPVPMPVSVAALAKFEDGSCCPPGKKPEIAPEQRLILIVDDNPDARRDLEEKLQ